MNKDSAEFGIVADGQSAPLGDGASDQAPAWEMIANGRYQPKRIKGSCVGRELG